jgi:hypothetical protein
MKLLVFVLIGLLVIGLIVGIVLNEPTWNQEKDYCVGVGVIYLLPNETDQINPNSKNIYVIPETKEIRGKSESLLCPNLNLNVWEIMGGE